MRTSTLLLAICLVYAVKSQTTGPPAKESKKQDPTILCGKNTHKIVNIGANTVSVFKTQRHTRRCTIIYKLAGSCTASILTCGAFYLPNKDEFKCRRGDRMYVKAAGGQPRSYCEKNKPTKSFPAISPGKLKVTISIHPSKMYPSKGATCTVKCDN
eukprot:TRINITY_DN993_c0_g1_i3.p1 TRINITY_DN993_c0_g1~~TRINITY_DN993_c0_g1_i3.p1  ORF type:complete len:156 (-),score=35.87 TRINITY_DN993_c0_g1_i3:231-698(-)